jgi:hypothetical protein
MDKHLKYAKTFSKILDDQFEVLGFKFGLDPIIGFIPIAGDVLPLVFSGYVAWIGHRTGMETKQILKIIINALLDILVGLVPVIGDFGDFFYKSHKKNYDLLEKHIASIKLNSIEGQLASH